MPLVFSALLPHSPLLVPEIGKEHLDKLSQTVFALRELEQNFYAAKPEVLFIVSSHGPVGTDRFYLNLDSSYTLDFSAFGYAESGRTFSADQEFILLLKSRLDQSSMAAQLITEQKLDYGFGVPLFYLTQHLPSLHIAPVSVSGLDVVSHFSFGQEIQREIQKSTKRIAVIASGDLAHAQNDPESAKKFDAVFVEKLKSGQLSALSDFSFSILGKATECAHKPAVVLAGILDNLMFQAHLLSYEAPLGVGLAVVYFELA